MRRVFWGFLFCMMVCTPATLFAGSYTVTQTPGKVIECIGTIEKIPATNKTYKITWTTFKNAPKYYTEEIKKGNTVIITNYNSANFQVIKI